MLHPVYYVIMLILTIGSYREYSTGVKQKQLFVIICVVMVIIAGIRVGQGADYWPYFGLYMGANKYVPWNMVFDRTLGIEPVYVILSKVCGSLHLPFTALLFTIAGFSIFFRSKAIYKFSPLPLVSLLWYYMPGFFASDMGQIRQGLATSICMFSFQYITSKKLYKYLICIYFAYLTHKATMIFIPAYWIANMNISTAKAFFIIILGVILWPLHPYTILGGWVNSISMDSIAAESYNSYSSGEDVGFFTATEVIRINFIIILFVCDKYILRRNVDENYMKVRNLVVMFYFLYYFFHGNPMFSLRLATVYQAFEIILIGMFLAYSNYRYVLYIYYIVYLYLMSWRFWTMAQKLGFDKFGNIFNSPHYSIESFTPHEFYRDEDEDNTFQYGQ